jgi:hypothetical protein
MFSTRHLNRGSGDPRILDIALRRALLELCLMFKDDSVIIKVRFKSRIQLDETREIPIPKIVGEAVKTIFVVSRSSNLIKPNFTV